MTAPYQPQKQSVLDRVIARLFPALQQFPDAQGLGRQGLMQIGANLLQAGGPSAQQQGTLANIGSAINGVDINALTKQALALREVRQEQASQEQIGKIVSQYQAPANETAEERFDRLTKLGTALIGVPGAERLLGPISNFLAQTRPEKGERARYTFRELEDPPGSGQFAIFRVNEDDPTDRMRIGVGREPPAMTAQTLPSEGERRAGALYTVAENAYSHLTQDFESPTFKDWLAGKAPAGIGQLFTSVNQQRRNQAGADFYRAWLYIVSGATVNPGEAIEAAKIILPQLGDDPATVQQKLGDLQVKLDAMRSAMGRAKGGAHPPPKAGGDYDDFLNP